MHVMTDVMQEIVVAEVASTPEVVGVVDRELVGRLVAQARAGGLDLVGEGGVLQQLTKVFLESALQGEMDAHLGYGKHEMAGPDADNSRNGSRVKTVTT